MKVRTFGLLQILILLAFLLTETGVLAQDIDSSQNEQLSNIELTMFSKAYRNDDPVKRLERLEQLIFGATKDGDLPSRLQEIVGTVDPSAARSVRTASPPSKNGGGQSSSDSENDFEKFPYVKWKTVRIEGLDNAYLKVITEFSGVVCYQATLFRTSSLHSKVLGRIHKIKQNIANETRGGTIYIELVNKNGFKITTFALARFRKVPGTKNVWQSKDSVDPQYCSFESYRQGFDYSAIFTPSYGGQEF